MYVNVPTWIFKYEYIYKCIVDFFYVCVYVAFTCIVVQLRYGGLGVV